MEDLKKISESTDEAMARMRSNVQLAFFIAMGRYVAWEICQKKGTVHSREVRDEMEARGLFIGYRGKEHWLGSVFREGPFLPTGATFGYSDTARNIHQRTVRVWMINPDAVQPEKPTIPEWLKECWEARGLRVDQFMRRSNA